MLLFLYLFFVFFLFCNRSLESGALIGITIVPAPVLPSVTRTEDVDINITEEAPVKKIKSPKKTKSKSKIKTTNGKGKGKGKGKETVKGKAKGNSKKSTNNNKSGSRSERSRTRTKTLKKVISVKYKYVYIIFNNNGNTPKNFGQFYTFLEKCISFSCQDWMKHFNSVMTTNKKNANVQKAKLLFARDNDDISKSWVKFLITKLQNIYKLSNRKGSKQQSSEIEKAFIYQLSGLSLV